MAAPMPLDSALKHRIPGGAHEEVDTTIVAVVMAAALLPLVSME